MTSRTIGPRKCMFTVISSLLLAWSPAASAVEFTVAVRGIESNQGKIGCSLYAGAEGFPMEPSNATTQWHDAKPQGVDCRFGELAPGTYAVAVSHDFNGNRATDTNFLGIPTEPWGVSNNVRPAFRAPTFEEAAVKLGQESSVIIEVELAE